MRFCLILAGSLLCGALSALNSIAVKEPLLEISPYLLDESMDVQDGFSREGQYAFNSWALPVESRLSPGEVQKGLFDKAFPYCFFVMGDDAFSRQWLSDNRLKLKGAKAIGFVTQVKTAQAFKALERLTELPLMAMSMDETAALFNVRHYPFAYCEGELWQ